VLGVHEKTVRNDLPAGAELFAPDLPVKSSGQDGKAYPRSTRTPRIGGLPRDGETERRAQLARRGMEDARGIERAIKTLTDFNAERRHRVRHPVSPCRQLQARELGGHRGEPPGAGRRLVGLVVIASHRNRDHSGDARPLRPLHQQSSDPWPWAWYV
jgi:hypothetical protein